VSKIDGSVANWSPHLRLAIGDGQSIATTKNTTNHELNRSIAWAAWSIETTRAMPGEFRRPSRSAHENSI
jgi:hypothetical protein